MAVAALALTALTLVVPNAGHAAGDANRPSCPASTESSPGFRAYLPDCRAYELVTPPYKEGATVLLEESAAISPDGADVIVGVGGAFAGAGNLWFNGNRNIDFTAYGLSRTPSGWEPTALTPPATQYPHGAIQAANREVSGATLWGLATTGLVFNESIFLRTGDGRLLPVGPGVGPEVASEAVESYEELTLVGASHDLTRSLYRVMASSLAALESRGGRGDLWPGDTTQPQARSLYEYVYSGVADAEPMLVGVDNQEPLKSDSEAHLISACGTELGSGTGGSAYNAVSENGETVFFTALAVHRNSNCLSINELYARVGGATTVAISEPSSPAGECGSGEPCSGAVHKEGVFQGASANGEYVFFLSEQPLVNGVPAAGVKLYRARLEDAAVAEVVDVSTDPTAGRSPEVQGVVRVAENGERVYFVAKGVLSGKDTVVGRSPEEAGPEEGADNLYVYEPDPAHAGAYHTVFVAKLLTPAEEGALVSKEAEEAAKVDELAKEAAKSAELEAVSHGAIEAEPEEVYREVYNHQKGVLQGTLGPSGTLAEDHSVWRSNDRRPAQATPDGGFLVFLDSADLTAGDESRVPQLFEYDAGRESLARISIGQGGTYGGDGNVETFQDAPRIPEQSFSEIDLPTAAESGLALSEDGSRVFFTSAGGLTPQANEGATGVYEYRAGEVYPVSGGRDAPLPDGSPTVHLFGIDPSGQDAFFTTADPLVPQDGETQEALYDAREGGGFPAPSSASGCAGETCRGYSARSPQLSAPGSANQAGGGNLVASISKPAVKPRSVTRAQRLAAALKVCAKKPRKRRAACAKRARKSYGGGSKAGGADRGGRR